jgi:hypothetical protein
MTTKSTLSQAAVLQRTPTTFSGKAKSHTHTLSLSLSLWQLACFPFFPFDYKSLMCNRNGYSGFDNKRLRTQEKSLLLLYTQYMIVNDNSRAVSK